MKARHLTAREFVRQPWKNAGGTTTELALHEEGAQCLWRLSVADIERSGPFSDFSGYERIIMLLEGDGMELTLDGAHVERMDEPFRPFTFDGAAKTQCRLLGGAVKDLNLMVDRERAQGSVTARTIAAPVALPLHASWVIVYVLHGAVTISCAESLHDIQAGELLQVDEAGTCAIEGILPRSLIADIRIQRKASR